MTTSTLFFHYEFEIRDEHDQTVASGDAPTLEEAENEGRHYLAQYQQDGPCTLELRQVKVLEVSSPKPTPDRPPLWRVMEQASTDAEATYHPFASSDRVLAAVIRAVRDWFHQHSDLSMKPATFHQIYDLLTAEAERAERGDG